MKDLKKISTRLEIAKQKIKKNSPNSKGGNTSNLGNAFNSSVGTPNMRGSLQCGGKRRSSKKGGRRASKRGGRNLSLKIRNKRGGSGKNSVYTANMSNRKFGCKQPNWDPDCV